MLAIIEQQEETSDHYTRNNNIYFLLLNMKLVLDMGVFMICRGKQYTSFITTCSLSIPLVDLVMVIRITPMMGAGPEESVSLCVLLANASATWAALPLPMTCLVLLDYCLEGTFISNQRAFFKILKNAVLTLLVWILAGIYAFWSVSAELIELNYQRGIKVCQVQESTLITYFTLGLFAAGLLSMPLYCSSIPQWVKQADRLFEERDEQNKTSNLLSISIPCMGTKSSEENSPEETVQPLPPLWFSLALGFGLFWMPYLVLSVSCFVFDFGIPAYISVNLLWLECTNSLLEAVVFWVKSTSLEPYSRLSKTVNLWEIYWTLSKGKRQQQLPLIIQPQFQNSWDKV